MKQLLTLQPNNETVEIVVRFIENYRQLEKQKLSDGYSFIKTLDNDTRLIEHLCGHWKNKKKDFALFYLNLSTQRQIRILHGWQILDEQDKSYLEMPEKDQLWAEAPKTINTLFKLLVFFNNNSIESYTSTKESGGLDLLEFPKKNKVYGNSANWGDYFLSIKDKQYLLKQII